MRTDERGEKMKKGTKDVKCKEGERGDQENAKQAVYHFVV